MKAFFRAAAFGLGVASIVDADFTIAHKSLPFAIPIPTDASEDYGRLRVGLHKTIQVGGHKAHTHTRSPQWTTTRKVDLLLVDHRIHDVIIAVTAVTAVTTAPAGPATTTVKNTVYTVANPVTIPSLSLSTTTIERTVYQTINAAAPTVSIPAELPPSPTIVTVGTVVTVIDVVTAIVSTTTTAPASTETQLTILPWISPDTLAPAPAPPAASPPPPPSPPPASLAQTTLVVVLPPSPASAGFSPSETLKTVIRTYTTTLTEILPRTTGARLITRGKRHTQVVVDAAPTSRG